MVGLTSFALQETKMKHAEKNKEESWNLRRQLLFYRVIIIVLILSLVGCISTISRSSLDENVMQSYRCNMSHNADHKQMDKESDKHQAMVRNSTSVCFIQVHLRCLMFS